VRDLPRQLTVEELAELFEGRTALVEQLAQLEDPLGQAHDVAGRLSDAEQKEVLDAHPAIGGKPTSARSATEQGTDDDPAVLAELADLNRAYEDRFGFRFVVFVNRRPRREIVRVLKERIDRSRAEELTTAVDELVQIAIDRWHGGR
jgi:2-oxo-4-hydroxy-4-carboxy-5-ureidoimidazoline decarboxylase